MTRRARDDRDPAALDEPRAPGRQAPVEDDDRSARAVRQLPGQLLLAEYAAPAVGRVALGMKADPESVPLHRASVRRRPVT